MANEHDFSPAKSYVALSCVLVLTLGVTYLIYLNTENFFKWSTRQQVAGIVATASLNFNTKDLDEIIGEEAINTEVYKKTVFQLQEIRLKNKNVRFAYIQKQTSDPTILEFVADADSINPNAKVDLNGDGIVDEDDSLVFPGDAYDVSDYPNFIDTVFKKVYVDEEVSSDQWGSYLAATSPIWDFGSDTARYIVGIDVDVSDYMRSVRLALFPFVLFAFFIVFTQVYFTMVLVTMWNSRVGFLRELDKQKDELLGLVSHQLATPVSGLRWNLEMFADGDIGPLNEKQKEELKTMQGVVGNLSDLVSMILDVSRIQLGRMKVDKTNIDLFQFLKEITEVLVPKTKEKEQDFALNYDEKLGMGFIDKRLTHMTIENLISNAVKYTPPKGRVVVNARVENGLLHFSVQDTGCGIPKADQEKIFGKLYRASNVAAVDGNGFGLYVAKGAIESQGGKIWFESEEGCGTTFYVELPVS